MVLAKLSDGEVTQATMPSVYRLSGQDAIAVKFRRMCDGSDLVSLTFNVTELIGFIAMANDVCEDVKKYEA